MPLSWTTRMTTRRRYPAHAYLKSRHTRPLPVRQCRSRKRCAIPKLPAIKWLLMIRRVMRSPRFTTAPHPKRTRNCSASLRRDRTILCSGSNRKKAILTLRMKAQTLGRQQLRWLAKRPGNMQWGQCRRNPQPRPWVKARSSPQPTGLAQRGTAGRKPMRADCRLSPGRRSSTVTRQQQNCRILRSVHAARPLWNVRWPAKWFGGTQKQADLQCCGPCPVMTRQ